jgi:hypothetical protein
LVYILDSNSLPPHPAGTPPAEGINRGWAKVLDFFSFYIPHLKVGATQKMEAIQKVGAI